MLRGDLGPDLCPGRQCGSWEMVFLETLGFSWLEEVAGANVLASVKPPCPLTENCTRAFACAAHTGATSHLLQVGCWQMKGVWECGFP